MADPAARPLSAESGNAKKLDGLRSSRIIALALTFNIAPPAHTSASHPVILIASAAYASIFPSKCSCAKYANCSGEMFSKIFLKSSVCATDASGLGTLRDGLYLLKLLIFHLTLDLNMPSLQLIMPLNGFSIRSEER